MKTNELKRGMKRIPTTFMVAGLANSFNKKILMVRSLAAAKVKASKPGKDGKET